MSYCPLEGFTGFVQLQGPIPTQTFQTLKLNGQKSPFTTSFGPRTTSATLISGHINDIANHTCTRNKSDIYTVVDIQICKPLHIGYKLPGVTEESSAEMIISLSGSSDSMIISVPIFNTGSTANDQYLSQVIHPPDPTISTMASLDTVFAGQSSFGYRACFETVRGDNTVHSNSLHVFIFPSGIHVSHSDYALLTHDALHTYRIPPALRNSEQTIQRSTIRDGVKQYTKLSDGIIDPISFTSCSDTFSSRFEYFLQAPLSISISNTTQHMQANTTQSYKPSQYKCVPFDQNKNLHEQNGDIYVTPGPTSPTLEQLLVPSSHIGPDTVNGLSATDIESMIGIFIAVTGISVMIGVVAYQLSKN